MQNTRNRITFGNMINLRLMPAVSLTSVLGGRKADRRFFSGTSSTSDVFCCVAAAGRFLGVSFLALSLDLAAPFSLGCSSCASSFGLISDLAGRFFFFGSSCASSFGLISDLAGRFFFFGSSCASSSVGLVTLDLAFGLLGSALGRGPARSYKWSGNKLGFTHLQTGIQFKNNKTTRKHTT